MTSKVDSDLLAQCLADLEAGRTTVEECLAEHPTVAADLRSFLDVARALTAPDLARPDSHFRVHARAVLIAEITGDKAASTSKWIGNRRGRPLAGLGQPGSLWPWSLKLSAIAATLIVSLIATLSGGAVYASQDALPGDALYPIKTTVEGWQVALAGTDEAKAQTYLNIATKRLSEIEKGNQKGDVSAVSVSAESFSLNLAMVDQYLSQAAESGKDVTATATQIAGNMGQHEKALSTAAEHAPGAAKSAIAKAAAASRKGLATASALVRQPGSEKEDGREPAVGAPTGDVGKSLGNGHQDQSWAARVPTTTAYVSTTINLTLTQTMSDVRDLSTDPYVSGESYNGLMAKLEAAQAALQRGQPRVATQILNAFVNQLNAFQRSGHISPENYDSLYASYSSLVSSLGGSPKNVVVPNKANNRPGQPGSDVEPTATPIVPSNATRTPEPDKKKDNPGQSGGKKDNTPTVSTPTSTGAGNPTNSNPGNKGTNGNANGNGAENGNGKNK